MSGRVLTVKEFGLEVGFRAEKIIEVITLPISVPSNGKEKIKAKYEYDVLMEGANYLLEEHVKPILVKKLQDSGVEFSSLVIIEKDVKAILDKINAAGNADEFKDVVLVIYKKPELIKLEYGLITKYDFAKKITDDIGLHIKSSLHRLNCYIEDFKIQPVAYSNKLAPLYRVEDLELFYSRWTDKRRLTIHPDSV